MAEEVKPTTATIVLTDLVGSTALRARLGEERADELRRSHDALLAKCVEAHGGRVVKGTGDGIVAAFSAAADGSERRRLDAAGHPAYNRRPGALARLSIRIGISTGDVSWEDGDCFGGRRLSRQPGCRRPPKPTRSSAPTSCG